MRLIWRMPVRPGAGCGLPEASAPEARSTARSTSGSSRRASKAADAAQDGRGVTARLARQRPDRFALLDMAQVKTQIAIPRIVAGGGLVLVSGRPRGAGTPMPDEQSGKRGVQGEISRQNCHDHSFAS